MKNFNRSYLKIILLFRWMVFFYLLTETFSKVQKENFLNFPQDIFLLSIGIYYLGLTLLSYFEERKVFFIVFIILDFVIASLFFLNRVIIPISTPPYTFCLLFSLPILQAGFLNFKLSSIIALISFLLFILLKETFRFFGIIKEPSVFFSSQFFYLISFFLLCYLFVYLFEMLKKQNEQTKALLSVIESGQELGTTNDIDKLIDLIINMLKSLFNSQSTVIYLKEEVERENILKIKGISTPQKQLFNDFNPEAVPGILKMIFKKKNSCFYEDFQSSSEEDFLPKSKFLRSIMAAPLIFEDKVLGLILLAHNQVKRYNGESLKLLTMLANQISLAIQNIQLHHATVTLAITDSLSGMYTHGYFQEHLEKEFIKHKYANQHLSLLIIDVDFFKTVNDTYGHPQGDSLLKQLGGLIKSIIPREDLICRYGGDEFTITMLNTNRISAVLMAERLRQAVEEYEFVLGSKIVHITISGGAASFPEDAQIKKELIENADRALYESKHKGRNRISFIA
ncbi:MAG: sensor domain-containing diguanylate cyclase [Armatimonadetes bacterium]|nr:sensor domain-containing diguanylate cyclase [Armatimonadota bacterium]